MTSNSNLNCRREPAPPARDNRYRVAQTRSGGIRAFTGGLLAAVVISSCSTYTTLRGGDSPRARTTSTTARTVIQKETPREEMITTYGLPYYLPKALFHLTVRPKSKPSGSSDPAPTVANTVTVNVDHQGVVTSDVTTKKPGVPEAPKPTEFQLPVEVAPPAPAASTPAAGGGKAAVTLTPAKEEASLDVTSYDIKLEQRIVPDVDSGVLYAHYKPNWLYSEDVKIGVNDKQLLATADTTSSDRTAQVIYNLADTAANLFKFAGNASLAFSSADPTALKRDPRAAKAVVYRKLNIDVTFDPLNEDEVKRVQRLFRDIYGETTIYISPFKVDVAYKHPNEGLMKTMAPQDRRGLFFRQPIAVEVSVTGRESVFLNEVADQAGAASRLAKKRTADTLAIAEQNSAQRARLVAELAALKKRTVQDPETVRDTSRAQHELDALIAIETARQSLDQVATKADESLATQLNLVRLSSGDHTETFASAIPNKYRTYAYNISRSAFVQNKQTNLSITDGQLGQVHLAKQSEVEGFSEIPLTLSKKLLELPKDFLTYRKEIITGRTAVDTERLNGFNAQENLRNTFATQAFTEQTALSNAQAAALKAQSAQLDADTALINSDVTNSQAVENAKMQAELARLKAESARINAENEILKARAARAAAVHGK